MSADKPERGGKKLHAAWKPIEDLFCTPGGCRRYYLNKNTSGLRWVSSERCDSTTHFQDVFEPVPPIYEGEDWMKPEVAR